MYFNSFLFFMVMGNSNPYLSHDSNHSLGVPRAHLWLGAALELGFSKQPHEECCYLHFIGEEAEALGGFTICLSLCEQQRAEVVFKSLPHDSTVGHWAESGVARRTFLT